MVEHLIGKIMKGEKLIYDGKMWVETGRAENGWSKWLGGFKQSSFPPVLEADCRLELGDGRSGIMYIKKIGLDGEVVFQGSGPLA
jgi:hypothetical protein